MKSQEGAQDAALVRLTVEVQRLAQLTTRLLRVLPCRRFQLAYRGAADDIFVVSYPKSGTTLMQMLMHQLLTDGNVSFNHIDEFSPSLEKLLSTHVPNVDFIGTLKRPHVVKSHLPYRFVPQGPGRYVYVMRNGLDVCVSYYHQMRRTGWTDPFSVFFTRFIEGGLTYSSWFQHVRAWMVNRDRLDVLYVTYEDLRNDFPATAQRVAEFCGVTVPTSEWSRISQHCSFGFMRSHEDKFDDMNLRRLPNDADHFVRRGQVGDWKSMITSEMLSRYWTKYDQELANVAVPRSIRGES